MRRSAFLVGMSPPRRRALPDPPIRARSRAVNPRSQGNAANRFLITMGTLDGTGQIVQGAYGVVLTYDKAGRHISATRMALAGDAGQGAVQAAYTCISAGSKVAAQSPKPMRAAPGRSHQPRSTMRSPSSR
ncbi:MAG: hypothetical protein LCH73_13610 [Proteobacteria bacterium]|nr:hypothetical protein [Pseudomonadota bacterium]